MSSGGRFWTINSALYLFLLLIPIFGTKEGEEKVWDWNERVYTVYSSKYCDKEKYDQYKVQDGGLGGVEEENDLI